MRKIKYVNICENDLCNKWLSTLAILILSSQYSSLTLCVDLVTHGPMARDVDTLILACRALWDGSISDVDPMFPPVIFNEQVSIKTESLHIDNGIVICEQRG